MEPLTRIEIGTFPKLFNCGAYVLDFPLMILALLE